MVCFNCGENVIEYDVAAGNGFCTSCGTVVEENTIVNEVTFGETSTGAAMVQGSYVAQGASGPWGNRRDGESREQTIANASRKIQTVAVALRISEGVATAAIRTYTLAVEHKFTKGRKSLQVIGVCLYVACRQQTTQNRYMLIDFADILQVNVFELGHTYLQLVQTLNLRVPFSDPSWFINRYAALLEFGEETQQVAADATRLVSRFNRDWMVQGRRPAGICGACILLAARMNNFRRSVEEIVQVVKIADTTLKKRLDEFRKTPSGRLTLADFRQVWLEEEADPPAFTKGTEKEENERKMKDKKDKGKKRRKAYISDDEETEQPVEPPSNPPHIIDPALFNTGILAGTVEPAPLFLPEDAEMSNIDPALLPLTELLPQASPLDQVVNEAVTKEVSSFLDDTNGIQVLQALDEAEQRRLASRIVADELMDLDDSELDEFILTEEEVKVKERVWVEMNKEYLEAIAAKAELAESGESKEQKSRKRRKTSTIPRDASTPHGSTAAESVRNLLKKNPKYSKRINYDALADIFKSAPGGGFDEDEKEDEELYTFDDKSEGETLVEEGNTRPTIGMDFGGVGESDKGEDYITGWDDTFEQEV